ncbi:MAG TPA: exodeoxyribonuclease V subunit gamma [Nocardioidaceae bacterium]|nr:exodeoxyribonuclease V subunit gamma [Nocardioidaceae bacterium]
MADRTGETTAVSIGQATTGARHGRRTSPRLSVSRDILQTVTLRIHRAERTDLLADGLADLLASPLDDPFAEELVVVPARGVERWLTQRLSHRLGVGQRGGDGVCAGVRFLSPYSLVAMLLGKERDDAWDPDRMVWALLEVIDEAMGEPWCATLSTHLGFGVDGDEGELRRSRRYSVARRIAGLFASYAVQRPRLVTDWREGLDTDGAGNKLDDDLMWQAELWRRLVSRVGEAPPDLRHAETLERLRGGGDGLDLPPRLSLFGHTRLPVTEVELLSALGTLRDVHLWLPQVSASLWEDLVEDAASGPVPREEDRSSELVRHPLLGSLGRDARELQRTLSAAGDRAVVEEAQCAADDGDTLLGWLQHDLRANAEAEATTRSARVLDVSDRSVQVHACHGAARQVDVLREVLAGLLEDDPTLEPRDILVMCPDIEAYAPLVHAGFGLADVADSGEGHPAHRLRVRLADRAPSSTNPLLSLAAVLVEVAGGRVTATEVLDLASADPVRRRFGFSDDDLSQLAMWVDQAGIRWGIDATHRGTYGLGLGENTWQAGLGRVLLGVAMAEDELRFVDATLPVDDVSSGDIDLVGRFSEYVDRLHAFVRATESASTIDEWTTALGSAVGQLATVAPRDAWQQAQFDRELARMHDSAGEAATSSTSDGGTALLLADVRNLLAHRLGGRPTRSNFRTGTLTVCTMVPMRSVPHRVVCLVGLDDGVFPRASSTDGDDVLARNPLTGERDVRSEDRQLFLDAILAARETLVVTYTGANEHTGAERPPAVPLGELLDTLDTTAAEPVRDRVLVRHPLQPFDVRNLAPGELAGPGPFSFDRAALAGAEAARAPRQRATALVPGPLPPRPVEDVALEDLQAFFAHPVRAFLRSRLDVSSPLEAEETRDAMPISLEGLDKWQIGDRLLAAVLGGTDPATALGAERLRGVLPPGALGSRTLQEVEQQVRPLVVQTNGLRQGQPRTLDVDIDLGDGRRLTGTVPSIFGNRIVTVTYSRLAAKHRLRSWIDLLALSVGHPDESWTAHALGRGRAGTTRALSGPLDHRAETWLRDLVDLYDRGMREPLPLPMKTACAYAEASYTKRRGANTDPVWKARKEWESDPYSPTGIPGEDADLPHVQVFGHGAPLERLMTPPGPDESWNDEPHRLGQYAWRLWQPLLEGAENVGAL